jgi:formiminotetrahydrofolate cyclodeaminase
VRRYRACLERRPTIEGVTVGDASVPFRDLTLGEFVDRLESSQPVPGGGSASAVVAGLGASLVAMVAALSEGRPKYAVHADTHARAGAEGRRLAARFLELADEDSAAYGGFAAAMKLPRDTDEERAVRGDAIKAAALAAALVPLECVRACRDLGAAAEMLAGRSNVNALSDLIVAALLGEAAARGAAANVRVNLPSVGDHEVSVRIETEVDGLLADVARLADLTREAVAAGEERDPLPGEAFA